LLYYPNASALRLFAVCALQYKPKNDDYYKAPKKSYGYEEEKQDDYYEAPKKSYGYQEESVSVKSVKLCRVGNKDKAPPWQLVFTGIPGTKQVPTICAFGSQWLVHSWKAASYLLLHICCCCLPTQTLEWPARLSTLHTSLTQKFKRHSLNLRFAICPAARRLL
jgi:hypothetical protein